VLSQFYLRGLGEKKRGAKVRENDHLSQKKREKEKMMGE